jgi:hypothetical protein
MLEEKVILAECLKYSFEDIAEDVCNHKNIIMLVEDDEGYWCGKYINDDNYDDMVHEFWATKNRLLYPMFFVNANIYQNHSKIDLPRGEYVYQIIRKILKD